MEKMRAVKIPCENKIELHQVPVPEPKEGWRSVQVPWRESIFGYRG